MQPRLASRAAARQQSKLLSYTHPPTYLPRRSFYRLFTASRHPSEGWDLVVRTARTLGKRPQPTLG